MLRIPRIAPTACKSFPHPCQCSFIPHRNCGDNIILARKVFHTMRTKRSGKGWLAIKVDLEKVYDMLKWKFSSHLQGSSHSFAGSKL